MPAISCDKNDLAKAAACYCFTKDIEGAVIVYLLAKIAGDTSTPAELAAKARCYCFDSKTTEQVQTMLLCAIANLPVP